MFNLFTNFKNIFKKKGEVETDTLIWWIIGAIILVIAVVSIVLSKQKGSGLICFVKNLFGNSAC